MSVRRWSAWAAVVSVEIAQSLIFLGLSSAIAWWLVNKADSANLSSVGQRIVGGFFVGLLAVSGVLAPLVCAVAVTKRTREQHRKRDWLVGAGVGWSLNVILFAAVFILMALGALGLSAAGP